MSWPYDYIIIGAGSAGCAIANRLAEDMALRILILEAGPPDTSFKLKMPAGFASLGENSPYNWRYETVPQKHCNDRRMYWPRGKTLGGSSSINAMIYVRGHASDYDHWRQLGNEGWSYREVLPFFKKAEHNERGASEYHGVNGPLNVTEQCDPLPINEAFFHACDERLGCKRNDDFNAAEQAGVGYFQVTQRNKERCSAASAYLKPALKRNRNNVHIVTNALVERIILDQNRAMGVRYVVGGLDEVARCSREIVLCGGAVNSPQLLMLSGIGPADHLRAHGIRPLHDLPGVGCNLQDHLSVAILQFAKSGVTYGRTNRLRALYQYVVSKKGPGTSPIAESGGFVRTHPGLHAPDLQLHFVPLLVVDQGRMQVRKDGYSLHVSNLRPESRGTIRLKSKNPKEAPLIDANYLAERRDLETLITGVRMGREILTGAAFLPYQDEEFQPGVAIKTDTQIEQWVRAKCETGYNPGGTCKMGPGDDPMAVVDSRCRVRGVEALRVVDASVMPTLVGGNANAPTIMIAERAAFFMKER